MPNGLWQPIDGVTNDVIAFPMHGFDKMVDEGFRTRDAHLIEWMSKLIDRGVVEVISRPEPKILSLPRKLRHRQHVLNYPRMHDHSIETWRLPSLKDRRRWWVDSARCYEEPDSKGPVPAVVWNPFVAVSNIAETIFNGNRTTVADLLDDWTVHYAFAGIHEQVEAAYTRLFKLVDHVTANSEGTAALARRLGRDDVQLITNGVDPGRFELPPRVDGPMTVGYVGKIGHRLDVELVCNTARTLRSTRFVFAGPILDSGYRKPLSAEPNIELLGDIHYDEVPSLLSTFDIGWVPHRLGEFEVGGDILKTYEYRASGLQVLTTPVQGAGKRGLAAVHVADAREHPRILAEFLAHGPRVPRDTTPIPAEHSWESKAKRLLELAGIA